jgi:CRP/FNR family transcriptional regulator
MGSVYRGTPPTSAPPSHRSFLGTLPADVVERVTADGDLVDYPAGTTFYREGDPPRATLVVTGLIRVYLSSSEGRQVTVRVRAQWRGPGTPLVVGGPLDVGALPSPHRACSTSTRGRSSNARVAFALAEELNRRLDDTLQQMAINAFGTVKQRVASHLLDLASARQLPQDRLVAHLSQQELADAIGSVREVVARALRERRLAGPLATSPDNIVILDPARLHDESWGSTARNVRQANPVPVSLTARAQEWSGPVCGRPASLQRGRPPKSHGVTQ